MKCPYCGSENTQVFYRTNMPYILSACSEEFALKSKQSKFEASVCKECLLGFNTSKLTNEELKLIYDNYYYISPTDGIGVSKYEGMIKTLEKYYSLSDNIMEIGCSDGYLLKVLKDKGFNNLVGIEPGPQAVEAKKIGVKIINAYFEQSVINSKYDGFYLMHVFEHFENPFKILKLMGKLLNDDGKIIIEVPNFDGYHHQHLFFYNIHFMNKLCRKSSLKIIDFIIEKGALRVVIVKNDNLKYNSISYNFNKIEFLSHLFNYFNKFKENIDNLNNILTKYEKIYWWGSGSSSVIYLNQIDSKFLNKITVVDGDKNKVNLFIPGTNFKVSSKDILKDKDIEMLVIASEFYNEIDNTIETLNIKLVNKQVVY